MPQQQQFFLDLARSGQRGVGRETGKGVEALRCRFQIVTNRPVQLADAGLERIATGLCGCGRFAHCGKGRERLASGAIGLGLRGFALGEAISGLAPRCLGVFDLALEAATTHVEIVRTRAQILQLLARGGDTRVDILERGPGIFRPLTPVADLERDRPAALGDHLCLAHEALEHRMSLR